MNDGFDTESVDDDMADVEHLLKNMSLKSPPESLNHFVENLHKPERPKFMHTWQGLLTLATASMIAGLLLGRLTGFEKMDSPTTSLTANEVDKSNVSPNVVTTSPLGSNAENETKTKLHDRGLYFVNGTIPVRKYTAQSRRQVEVFDSESGTTRKVSFPVSKTIVTPAPGI